MSIGAILGPFKGLMEFNTGPKGPNGIPEDYNVGYELVR